MIRLVAALAALTLSGCCTSTLQPGCDPQPRWSGYVLTDTNPKETGH